MGSVSWQPLARWGKPTDEALDLFSDIQFKQLFSPTLFTLHMEKYEMETMDSAATKLLLFTLQERMNHPPSSSLKLSAFITILFTEKDESFLF